MRGNLDGQVPIEPWKERDRITSRLAKYNPICFPASINRFKFELHKFNLNKVNLFELFNNWIKFRSPDLFNLFNN